MASTTATTDTTDQTQPVRPAARPVSGLVLGIAYAVVVFLSAFLLFQVQPLISKAILPWFGGTPSVWTTCMLFFQSLLFGGYAYAHLNATRLRPMAQAAVHVVLLAGAVLLLPILPDAGWKPSGDEDPTLRIVLMLLATLGLPFFVLSATGPLLQGWFARTHPGRSPYRLYALSNVGSLLALVTYPVLVETTFGLTMQSTLWSGAFVVFALGCGYCAVRAGTVGAMPLPSKPEPDPQTAPASEARDTPLREADVPPTWSTRGMWFALAMVPSVMLLATTNQVCLDVASVPFLWVLPLTLYLLTFILCFESDRWYSRWLFGTGMVVTLGCVVAAMITDAGASIEAQVLVYFAALFFTAMFCHGELAAMRPHPRYLTGFYLLMSAGGAAGGLFVGVVAPYLFDLYLEMHLAILAALALLVAIALDPTEEGKGIYVKGASLVALVLGFALLLGHEISDEREDAVATTRNFYGVLRITEHWQEDLDHQYKLVHGRILHGKQYIARERRQWPTTYYGEQSGVGMALLNHRPDEPRHVGVVGLGTGTIATYGKPGDVYTYYEINADVVRLVGGSRFVVNAPGRFDAADDERALFTYLRDSAADVEIVLGDARLSLEQQEPQEFDVLALDAFSSDAIPIHLLTREAFQVYRQHLKPDGILAVHISNRHFDLRPVVAALADELGLAARVAYDDEKVKTPEGDERTSISEWILVSQRESTFHVAELRDLPATDVEEPVLWTDDRSNLFEVLEDRSWKQRKKDLLELFDWVEPLWEEVVPEDEDSGEE